MLLYNLLTPAESIALLKDAFAQANSAPVKTAIRTFFPEQSAELLNRLTDEVIIPLGAMNNIAGQAQRAASGTLSKDEKTGFEQTAASAEPLSKKLRDAFNEESLGALSKAIYAVSTVFENKSVELTVEHLPLQKGFKNSAELKQLDQAIDMLDKAANLIDKAGERLFADKKPYGIAKLCAKVEALEQKAVNAEPSAVRQ